MKKVTFKHRMEAIDWIADHAESEAQFEVWREQLNFNFIYTGSYFLDLSEPAGEIVMLDKNLKK